MAIVLLRSVSLFPECSKTFFASQLTTIDHFRESAGIESIKPTQHKNDFSDSTD
jgi:hypothetical protein